LVSMRCGPLKSYVVQLRDPRLIKEVRGMVSQREHSKAIIAVLSRGMVESESDGNSASTGKVDLILSKASAHWDLT
jgi:hypothetical protein